MGNKKYLAIAIVLILGGGLGTFVFANPASPEEETTPEYNRNINETKNNDNSNSGVNNTNNGTTTNGDKEETTTPEESTATDNTVIPNVSTDIPIINDDNSNSSSNSSNSGNNGVIPNENNNDNSNNSVISPNTNNNGNNNGTDNSSINKVESKDTTAPMLTVSTNNTNLTNKNVVVTIKANEKIKSVTGWTLSSDRKAISKTVTKNESGNVTVSDLAGNKSSIFYSVKNIDKDSPIISVNYSTKSLTNKDVTVTIKSNKKIKPLDGWTLSSDAKALSKVVSKNESGEVKTYDLAGNISNEITYKVDNIDKEVPVLEEANYDIESLTNKDVTVTIKSNEKIKPLDGWTLSSDAKALSKVVSKNESGKVKTYDLAGNISNEITYKVDNIDKEAPKVNVTTSNSNGNKVTWRDVDVVITSNEPIKAIDGWDLLDNLTLTKTFSDNVKESLKVSDLAGNEIEVPYEVKNIDKNSPEVTTIKTVSKQGKTTIQVKIEYSDGTIITKTVDENSNEIILDDGTVMPVQNSANLELVLSNVINGVSTKTNKPVTAMIKSDKEIASWSLSNEEFNWNLTDTKTLISDDIYKISDQYVTVQDVLGNLTTIYVNVLNVDAIAPTINSVKASEKSGGIEVKFTASERLNVIDSWKNTTTRITFTKVFSKDEITKPIEVTLVDLYNNSNKIAIYVTDNKDGTYSASFKNEEELEKEQILELCS